MTLQKNLAQIVKTKNKKFRVKYFGKNGELLAPSQVETTRNNCKKNIIAMAGLFNTVSGRPEVMQITVLDLSGRAVRKFALNTDGEELELDVM